MLAVVLFCLMVIKVLVKNQHFQNSAKYKTTNLSIKTKSATNIEEYMGGGGWIEWFLWCILSYLFQNELPPPQAIQPVMSIHVRRLKFETKTCVVSIPTNFIFLKGLRRRHQNEHEFVTF